MVEDIHNYQLPLSSWRTSGIESSKTANNEEVSRLSTGPAVKLGRERMRRESIKRRQRMRQKLCRFETDLTVFGQAFKEATWAERLGVINVIALKNKMEELQKELEAVSINIEMLEEERRKTGKEDAEEVLKRMVVTDVVSPLDNTDEEMVQEADDT